jgi:uncharacterized protein (DUF2236 family)
VALTTFGTTEDAERLAGRVRRLHSNFTATDPDSGETYRVDDPELLLWVHCCEVDSLLSTARRGGLRLSDAEADRYVAEQVRGARLIGIPAEMAPRTTAQLAEYFEELRPRLHATRDAYDGLRVLAAPPMRWWVRLATPAVPSWAGLFSVAFGLLPGWARRLYLRVPSLPGTELTAVTSLRTLRAAALALPPSLREGPAHRAAKARIAGVPVRRLESA